MAQLYFFKSIKIKHMNTKTQLPATNDLRHTIDTTDKDGNSMRIKIHLNDECKNGHQDFSITAGIWQKDKPKTDRYYIMGGCCHDEIIATMPELKIFVNLHLCDYKGIPMHAVENGFYFLREGFSDTKPDSKKFKKEFCAYYRITEDQFQVLNIAENKLQYALALQNIGILKQWETQANEAISRLEEMTSKKFLIDSKKTQFNAPTPKQIQAEKEKQESGYYTPEAKAARQLQTIEAQKIELINEFNKKLNDITEEHNIKLQVLIIGGKAALDNCIYYNHSKTLAFNWKGYESISVDLIAKIQAEIKLPQGASFENKNK